jgi:hypothetical protein
LCDEFVGHFQFFWDPEIYEIMHGALTKPLASEPDEPDEPDEPNEPDEPAGPDEPDGDDPKQGGAEAPNDADEDPADAEADEDAAMGCAMGRHPHRDAAAAGGRDARVPTPPSSARRSGMKAAWIARVARHTLRSSCGSAAICVEPASRMTTGRVATAGHLGP